MKRASDEYDCHVIRGETNKRSEAPVAVIQGASGAKDKTRQDEYDHGDAGSVQMCRVTGRGFARGRRIVSDVDE